MNNLKRFTSCKLAGHRWKKVRYPPDPDGGASTFFLRCARCDKEDHDTGAVPGGMPSAG